MSSVRLKSWKVGGSISFNLPTFNLQLLVDEILFVGADAFAEHVVRPALVGDHDGDEDQGDDGHNRQCILRGGSVVDGE